MKHLKKSSLALLVILLVAGVLALTGCSATPLPPLFLVGGSGAAQPAAPAVLAPASEPAAVEAPAIVASEAVTTPEAVVTAQPAAAAPAASAAVTETSALDATGMITASVRAADIVTITAPITSSVVITPAEAVVTAAQRASTPTATRVAPTATRMAPTATRVAPTATRVAPAATRAPARPAATPTPEWPKTLVITAEDIEQGASSVPGLQISGLDVTFGNNTMTMTFDSLRYSFVSMRNVAVQGRFVVNNCDVDFVADSISPRNLATGAIPGFINQSLDQQLGAWCVEALAMQPGQLVATVRPR